MGASCSLLHMKGSRTSKTAFAQGKSWFNYGLKAWASALMRCQKSPPARKPGMSHGTGRRNLPIWIEKHEQNFAFSPRFSSLLHHIRSCTVILSNCTLQDGQTSQRKAKIHRRSGEGVPISAFFFFFFLKGEKLRQGCVKGLKGHLVRVQQKVFFTGLYEFQTAQEFITFHTCATTSQKLILLRHHFFKYHFL